MLRIVQFVYFLTAYFQKLYWGRLLTSSSELIGTVLISGFFLEQVPDVKYKIMFSCQTCISYLDFMCAVVNLVKYPH